MANKQNSSRKSTQSILLGIVISVVMLAGFYVLYYTPTNKKIESILSDAAEEERSLQTVRTQAPLLKSITANVKSLEQQIGLYRAKLAKTGEVISLIKAIEGEAQKLGLKVMSMHTVTEVPTPSVSGDEDDPPVQADYAKVTLDSDMQADYYKLEGFLDTLHKLDSFVMIDSMDVEAEEDEEIGSELNLSFEMSLYSVRGDGSTYVAKK